jgi:hypothetical protein
MTGFILDEIRVERARQDTIWGGPAHDDTHTNHDWISFIIKQLGKAVISTGACGWDHLTFRHQMLKVAALAVAAIEWCDRNFPIETRRG